MEWDFHDLDRAAKSGDPEAAHRAALLTAVGLNTPHDPLRAMERLRHAAGLGHDLAMRSLALLDAEPGGIDAWFHPPSPELVSTRPHILIARDFVSPAVCKWLADRARPGLEPAEIYDSVTGEGRADQVRTNTSMSFGLAESDMVIILLRERIARLAGLPVTGLENCQVLRYEPGQSFDWHVDFLDPGLPGHRDDLARRGQRIATCLVWLNADFDGGETAFAEGNRRLKGSRGDAVLWANVLPDGRPDRLSRHAGLPPTHGEKWVLSQWMRPFAPRG